MVTGFGSCVHKFPFAESFISTNDSNNASHVPMITNETSLDWVLIGKTAELITDLEFNDQLKELEI